MKNYILNFDRNHWPLNFKDPQLESKFRESYYTKSIHIVRIAFIIASLLYMLFGLFDAQVSPEKYKLFLLVRFAIVLPILLGTLLLSYTPVFKKIWQQALVISFIASGTGIIFMLAHIPGNVLYYGGLFLVFLAGFFFIRLRFAAAAFSGISLILIFNAFMLILGKTNGLSAENLVLSNSFYLATVLIGNFASYYLEKLERNAFYQNEILLQQQKEIAHINKTLEDQVHKRTAETKQRNRQLQEEIARQKTLKKSLKKSEIRFRAVFEQAASGIAIALANGKIIDVNPTFANMLGYSKEELCQLFVSDITYPDDKDYERNIAQSILNGEISQQDYEKRFLHKDGPVIWANLSTNAVRDEDGAIQYLIGVILDITASKQAQQALVEAKEKAEESNNLKSAFLNNISHEFRTPLNGILGFASLLSSLPDSTPRQKRFTELIVQSGNRLLDIITDTIEISQVQTNSIETKLYPCNIKEILDEVIDEAKPLLKEKGLRLDYKSTCDKYQAQFLSDGYKLKRILRHLVNNAIKFTQEGFISILCMAEEDYIQVEVADSGIGIKKSKQEDIFDPFFQLEKGNSRNYGGSGLGLSLAKSFVEQLGGTIALESEENIGTQVRVQIPVPQDA